MVAAGTVRRAVRAGHVDAAAEGGPQPGCRRDFRCVCRAAGGARRRDRGIAGRIRPRPGLGPRHPAIRLRRTLCPVPCAAPAGPLSRPRRPDKTAPRGTRHVDGHGSSPGAGRAVHRHELRRGADPGARLSFHRRNDARHASGDRRVRDPRRIRRAPLSWPVVASLLGLLVLTVSGICITRVQRCPETEPRRAHRVGCRDGAGAGALVDQTVAELTSGDSL